MPAFSEGLKDILDVLRRPCGHAATKNLHGHVAYVINVLADAGGATTGCGAPGRTVSFSAGGRALGSYVWDNTRAQYRTLSPTATTISYIYLPVVFKNN